MQLPAAVEWWLRQLITVCGEAGRSCLAKQAQPHTGPANGNEGLLICLHQCTTLCMYQAPGWAGWGSPSYVTQNFWARRHAEIEPCRSYEQTPLIRCIWLCSCRTADEPKVHKEQTGLLLRNRLRPATTPNNGCCRSPLYLCTMLHLYVRPGNSCHCAARRSHAVYLSWDRDAELHYACAPCLMGSEL